MRTVVIRHVPLRPTGCMNWRACHECTDHWRALVRERVAARWPRVGVVFEESSDEAVLLSRDLPRIMRRPVATLALEAWHELDWSSFKSGGV